MKNNGFVEAVTTAINRDSDCWEAEYYCRDNFNVKKLAVYMHSRYVALGSEWHNLQHCIVMMSRGRLRERIKDNVEYQLIVDSNN